MPKIQIFRKLDLDSLSAKELATWNRWVKALDERVNEVRDIITDCNRYMARSNLDTVIGHRHLL